MSKLPPADVDRFFQLYRSLFLYVNERLQVWPAVRTSEDLAALGLDDHVKLRDPLYDQPELIDQFVTENPAGLTGDDLTEIKSWSRFIRGDFYIVRHLKRYSVFLSSGQPARAYGVLGLSNSIADMFPSYALPVYLNTVLLPFNGQIIWDGLITYHNITFGPGIRADLNETYQRVKQREGIRESLTAPETATAANAAASRSRKSQSDLKPLIQGIVEAAEHLRPGATPLQSRTYGLLRVAAHLAKAVANDPTDRPAIDEQIRALTPFV